MTQAEPKSPTRRRLRLSLREYFAMVTIAMLLIGLVTTAIRLQRARAELARLRAETGYLSETGPGQIAASRAPSDEPLTYRLRVRIPESVGKFRVAYSTLWPKDSPHPMWYGAVPVATGESHITVRIGEDPRDDRWKIAAVAGTAQQTRRMATVLPSDHVAIFRGSHEVIRTGIGRETFVADPESSIRLLDERWLVGEGALLLYGDRSPERDQVGVYAELQPDTSPL